MTDIVHTDREQWLAQRRTLVMASEAAAILGLDPYRGPLSVYAEKVEGLSVEETKMMRWGRRVEGAISEGYEEETGRKVVDRGPYTIDVHPDIPWLGATLDRDVVEVSEKEPLPVGAAGPGAAEFKAVAGFKAKDWREQPPDHFLIQLQIQLACTGRQWGSLCALLGGLTLAWRDILRHERFLAAALPKLEEFHLRVKRRDPPPADGSEGTAAAIKRLWPDESGETIDLGAKGREVYEALLARDSSDVEARRGLARVAGWSGDLALAESEWRRALATKPAHVGG
jgi:putative phage-type endonuclease